MTLQEKLSLPAPKWLLFGLIILIVIGVAKLLMWFVPLVAAAAIKIVLWVAPIGWQLILAFAAFTCAVIAMAWRLHKQRKLYEDVMAGTTILLDAEYSVGE